MALLTALTMPASSEKNPIKVNQVGYLTHESKIATIEPEAKTKSFLIRDQEGKTVWRTKHATTKKSPFSSWRVRTPGSSPGLSCHGASFGCNP